MVTWGENPKKQRKEIGFPDSDLRWSSTSNPAFRSPLEKPALRELHFSSFVVQSGYASHWTYLERSTMDVRSWQTKKSSLAPKSMPVFLDAKKERKFITYTKVW